MPAIVSTPAEPNGTSTFTTSDVFDTMMPGPPPANVTATLDVSNLRSVVELIVSVSPPFGVALENAPPKPCGSTATWMVSLTPPPPTTTQEGLALTAVTIARADVFGTG